MAPDLIGFGRSDKPVARAAYSVQAHVDWLAPVHRPRRPLRPDPRRPGLGRPDRVGRPQRPPRARPPGRRRQHGAAHGRPRAGGTAGMALPRRPGRHRHRGADAARLPAPHPGAHAVPPEPVRAGGHRVGCAGRRPGGLRRAVPRRDLLRRAAPAPAADGPHARQRVRAPEPPHHAGAGRLRRPVPHRVLRRRSRHPRLGRSPAGACAGCGRPAPRHRRGCRAFPPGGRRHPVGRCRGALRGGRTPPA